MSRRNDFVSIFLTVLCCLMAFPSGSAVAQDSPSQRSLRRRDSSSPLEQLQQLLYEQRLRDIDRLSELKEQTRLTDGEVQAMIENLNPPGGATGQSTPPTTFHPADRDAGKKSDLSSLKSDSAQRMLQRLSPNGHYDSFRRLMNIPRRETRGTERRDHSRIRQAPQRETSPLSSDFNIPLLRGMLQQFSDLNGLQTLAPEFQEKLLTQRLNSGTDDPSLQSLQQSLMRGTDGVVRPRADSSSSFDISDELSRKGLGSTLTRLFRDAQQQAAREISSEDPGLFNSLVQGALEAMRGDINSIIQHLDDVTDNKENRKQFASRRLTAAADYGTKSPLAAGITAAAETAAGGLTSSSATSTTQFPAASSSALSKALLDSQGLKMIALLLAIISCGVCWLALMQRRRVEESHRRAQAAAIAVSPADIHTREDIVRAFHWLTRRDTTSTESWWTHRRAAQQLAHEIPAIQQPLNTLADIYEWARYDAREDASTHARIQAAQIALAGCLP